MKCNECPTPAACREDDRCWNQVVTTQPNPVYDALKRYDETMAANKAARAVDPKWQPLKPVDAKPLCWHNRNAIGICLNCGDWAK